MSLIRVGVVGVGIRGRHALEIPLSGMDGVRLKAVSFYPESEPVLWEGGGEASAIDYAKRYGAEYVEDWRMLVRRDDIDLISVMVEPAKTAEVVREAAAAGKAMVCDKPIAVHVRDAESICRAVAAAGVPMLVFFWLRHTASFRHISNRLTAGEIGKPLAASVELWMDGGPLPGFRATKAYVDSYGGGEVTNFGCYAIDYLCRLLGEPVAVQAMLSDAFYDDYAQVGMESLGTVLIKFASGAVGHLVTGRIPGKAGCPIIRASVTGEKGTLYADGAQLSANVYGEQDARLEMAPKAQEELLADFVRELRTGSWSGNLPGAEDALAVTKVLRAVYRSAQIQEQVLL
ncbi:Gfo/Idh/MocA family protein [Paenibacillus oceani]|uniref:Gfo/Idh/MocA family oxidoreductase n=1 Tax=Paenibacillus oceani TaxID=2772510 RepID=A0A927CFA0_9BACL|nr:Gfo/Idh/MocA family oxidoreductase [Paenibacillus oceani]MBD2865583.1 Gfo/Idh/MocA family oxidoreductase [Paenibacillus oceani]